MKPIPTATPTRNLDPSLIRTMHADLIRMRTQARKAGHKTLTGALNIAIAELEGKPPNETDVLLRWYSEARYKRAFYWRFDSASELAPKLHTSQDLFTPSTTPKGWKAPKQLANARILPALLPTPHQPAPKAKSTPKPIPLTATVADLIRAKRGLPTP